MFAADARDIRTFRIYRAVIACALVWALIAPATSSAQDGRAAAPTSSLAGTTSQDLRAAATTSSLAGTTSQDLRAAATTSSLAGTTSSDRRSPVAASGGIDWRAAGTAVGMIILGLAGATAITHRRRHGPRTATVA